MSKWTAEEDHLLRLLRSTNTISEIESQFLRRHNADTAGFTTLRTAQAIETYCKRNEITKDSKYVPATEDTWLKMNKLQERYTYASVDESRGINLDITTKILSLSDIHFPLARVDLLEQILDEHSDADIVVANGDIIEGHAFSSFESSTRIAALHEYQLAFQFVKLLSQNFPKVVLVQGNHEVRVGRAMKAAGINSEQSSIFNTDILARIANGEWIDQTGLVTEKHEFKNVYYDPVEPWYARIGKTIFIHPHSQGSAQPGFTVKKAYDSVFSRRYTKEEFDCIVSGHTHQIYTGVVNNTLLMEQGCLAGLLPYGFSPQMKYTQSSHNGYALIFQDKDGNTDFNESRVVYAGMRNPTKKESK